MITLISTPACADPIDPSYVSRWVATESPNNFRLHRHDFDIVTAGNIGGDLQVTVAPASYTGGTGHSISVFNKTLNKMFTGLVVAGSTTTTIVTDIPFIVGFDPLDTALVADRLITYVNDNTLYGGYYFEGRLTINGIVNSLTIIASPDSFGYADVDVSGVLRVMTSLLKTGVYSMTPSIAKEPTKSGCFSFEYREKYWRNTEWGEEEGWIPEGGSVSPPSDEILWYYGECVRSEEQGSNLHEYVATAINDAPFLNLFENPVYFLGLPFDLSFILPEQAQISPASHLTVTVSNFNSANAPGTVYVAYVDADALEGFINSLTIDTSIIDSDATYITVEITTP